MPAIPASTKIAEHRDEEGTLTWIEVTEDGGYHAGFALEDDKTMIETVDFETARPVGFPNWDEACEVDLAKANDPDLVRELEARFGIKERRMSQNFAVFNGHVNDGANRANAEFIAQFGQDDFDAIIAPLHEAGIMSIFELAPTPKLMAWVALCTAFVNEGAA